MQRPTIVCLCGSTRFGAAFQRADLVYAESLNKQIRYLEPVRAE